MAKNQLNEHPVTEQMLEGFEVGQPIARYCFFVNLTFKGIEDGNVVIADCNGDTKKHPKWLFLKHARVAK